MAKKIDYIILLIWAYIVIALPTFSVLYLLVSSSNDTDLFPDLYGKTIDFPAIIGAAIILPVIGVILSILRKKIKIVYFWKLDNLDKIKFVTISLTLSTILWRFFHVLYYPHYFGLIILFTFFLFYLPMATVYLNSIDINKLKVFTAYSGNKSVFSMIKNILFALAVLLLIHKSVIYSDEQIRSFNYSQLLMSRYPQITNAEPKIVYYGNKVILKGRRFGWKGTVDTKFKYNNGQIKIDLWTDTKVIFTIPLHWKVGEINVWIERPTDWEDDIMILRSNEIKVQLISRDNGWDKEDDVYFEQLKHIGKEALELNGYKKD